MERKVIYVVTVVWEAGKKEEASSKQKAIWFSPLFWWLHFPSLQTVHLHKVSPVHAPQIGNSYRH